jgi:citrate lyase beta subunit
MLDTYQFIRYNADYSLESILNKCESGAVICFDLEDSVCNWIDENQNQNLKKEYRKILNKIISEINSQSKQVNIGIRINSSVSKFQDLDFESIPFGSRINTLLIPKVEKFKDIDNVENILKTRGIIFNEIIPIIESKKGLENLEETLEANLKIKKVGFGHCDYNLSIQAFPFFHQVSAEYWKWVNRMIKSLKKYNIKFINSAFLNLNDSAIFQSILSHLQVIYPNNFGQFTLSHNQTILCKSFSENLITKDGIATIRFDLSYNKRMLTSLISSFEIDNNGQGFTIKADTNTIVSPQEYCSAKLHLHKLREKDINFTFVGGCFPVQDNILFEDIFHQKLKREIENVFDVNFKINIIRYERFSNCLEKVISASNDKAIDYLVFHIRPEPFLRLIKLYYKYLNHNSKLCRSLNISFLKILNPEKYDLQSFSRGYNYSVSNNRTIFYKALINVNYLFGFMIGNYNYALKKYLILIKEIISLCESRKIKVIILGPAIRSNTFLEALFSKRLEKYMSKSLKSINVRYVFGLEKHNQNGKRYFSSNGIHATQLYHDLISDRLKTEIEKDLKLD